jgi:isoquinoline 1-oxidoreductase subunit beta
MTKTFSKMSSSESSSFATRAAHAPQDEVHSLEESLTLRSRPQGGVAKGEGRANMSRRAFVLGSAAAAGGGLALGFNIFGARLALAQTGTAGRAAITPEVNAWVVVKPDESVVIRVARSEMGQGTITGLAQLVAEELECDWSKVTTENVTPGANLARNRVWGEMGTGGSRGIRTSHDYVRRGGAAARIMLIEAAAQGWKVPAGECSVSHGVITHGPTKRTTTYGKVAAAAGKLTPPDAKSIQLKDPKTWTVAGQPMKRLDTLPKLNGSKIYAIDMKLPGMLIATIKDCPVFGGKVKSYDEAAIKKKPGVKKVVKVGDSAVAVVADTFWHAKTALDALPIVWDEGESAQVSDATIAKRLADALDSTGDTNGGRSIGDAVKAIEAAPKKLEAVYSTPFLAHATMEPGNCTVRVWPDKAEAWLPTQNADASIAALANASGLEQKQCDIHRLDLGGGFGRRGGTQDYIHQAVAIAKAFPAGTPIKMIWTREEDMAHDFYRPISQAKLRAGLDEQGNLTGLHIRVAGQSINAWLSPGLIKDGKDDRQLQGYAEEPGDAQFGYGPPNLLIEYMMRNTHVPVGPWRGVNTNQNAVYLECFMDECAKAAGKDPLEFRRGLMAKYPKHLAVLNAAAEKAGWGAPLPAGVHRGCAHFMGYGSYTAGVAEVSVSAKGDLKVHRLVLATNCGHAVNPGQITAQVEGSVAYGLTAVLYGEMPVKDGRMTDLNFDSYQIMRLAEMPKVETVIVPSYDFWGGVGEPTIAVVAPAVLNAIFAATGKPVRSLPLKNISLV